MIPLLSVGHDSVLQTLAKSVGILHNAPLSFGD